MGNAVAAGFRYFLIVFTIGFGLGTLRTLVVAPRIGDIAAVGLELPLMLVAAWLVCRRLTRHVAPRLSARLVMGGTAFAMLMATEVAMAAWLFGRPPAVWAAGLATVAGALGLAGQIGFGLMPLLARR